MALYSPAIKRLIPPGPNDPRIKARVLILHIAVSESASLYDWFNGRSGGVESHFYVRRDGTVEQYRDTAFEADANTDANRFAISIETQGMEHGEWTPQQMAAIKALINWCHNVHDIPKTVPKSWDGSGVGFHTQFPGRWDKRGASCPGPDRKRQYWDTLVPWMGSKPGGAQSIHGSRPGPKPKPSSKPKPATASKGKLTVDGLLGPATYKALQKAIGANVDGVWGPQTRRMLQRHLKVAQDGIVGRRTIAALQRKVGTPVDSIWGRNTTKALQRALNKGTF